MDDSISIRPATTADDMSAVRVLCWAYRDFLLNDSGTDSDIINTLYPVDKYHALMDRLEREHARPKGIILLAERDSTAVGCGMTHALNDHTSELKRVFVTKPARGQGIAGHLCKALMDQARHDGFRRMVLDTSKSLTGAQRLYARLGFAERGAYQPIPAHVLPHLVFFETTL